MDRGDQSSIDVNHLEIRFTKKFRELQSLSKVCCIYRVPPGIRNSDERIFTPNIVSIGPIHYRKHGLQAMEVHKWRYLIDFFGRTERSMSDLANFILENECRLRDYYSETIELESHDFVEMVLVDAVFIIELLLKVYWNMDGQLLANSWMIYDIWPDLFLLENQLPMFILSSLFELAKAAQLHTDSISQLSMPQLIHRLWSWKFLMIEEQSIINHFFEAQHFVDLIRLCLMPPNQPAAPFQTLTAPSVTELHRAGVKFALGSNRHLLDIRFNNGILEIPKLKVVDETEGILRNLLVFEILHCGSHYVSDYMKMMNYLVNKPEDVDLLVNNEVLENWLWNGEAVSNIFQNHVKRVQVMPSRFYYSGLATSLNTYTKSPWGKWKAKRIKWTAHLKQNYCNSPWTIISVIAASILLILTFLQTLYAMKK